MYVIIGFNNIKVISLFWVSRELVKDLGLYYSV